MPVSAAADCLGTVCFGSPDVAQITGIAAVTDGDTLDVGPVRVRLYGIDAPEAGQPCKQSDGSEWPCGDRATERLAELADGKAVRCLARERDPYGRIVAICEADGRELNAALMREGLAWAFVRYSEDYVPLETKARDAALGVWQAISQPPWEYRANKWQRAADASPRPGCPVKGNINREGEKIYHTPWSPVYDRTKITQSHGERWFCDEAEALAEGWRPARWR